MNEDVFRIRVRSVAEGRASWDWRQAIVEEATRLRSEVLLVGAVRDAVHGGRAWAQ